MSASISFSANKSNFPKGLAPIWIVLIVLVLTGIVWGVWYLTGTKQVKQGASEFYIKFELDAPFSKSSLEVNKDGEMAYFWQKTGSEERQKERGEERIKIEADQIDELRNIIEKNNFYSLINDYPATDESPLDGSTYSLTITTDAKTKSVSCYQFECPGGFVSVATKIRQLWGKEILEEGV